MKKILCVLLVILSISFAGCSKAANPVNAETDYKKNYEKLLSNQPPVIKEIKFETPDGKPIEPDGGWYMLGNKVKIIITLEGDCQEVDLFITPAGSCTYKDIKLIDMTIAKNNIAEYTWDVPQDTMGHLQVIAYNKNAGRRSETINVTAHK